MNLRKESFRLKAGKHSQTGDGNEQNHTRTKRGRRHNKENPKPLCSNPSREIEEEAEQPGWLCWLLNDV